MSIVNEKLFEQILIDLQEKHNKSQLYRQQLNSSIDIITSQLELVEQNNDNNIDDLYQKLSSDKKRLTEVTNSIQDITAKIKILRQICSHTDKVFSHYTYHDHYDEVPIYRCLICGDTVG